MAVPSALYDECAKRWVLPRTLMGGTPAMRAAKTTFLPQEPQESDEAYKSRLERSTLFNGYRKTVRDMAGKVFAKPVVLGEDVPTQIAAWAENIDMTGRHLSNFAYDVFVDALEAPGVSYILTDMPPAVEGGTRAD
ncbi:MAG: DNA-binding protein, partial [Verrucomicrobiota bacterium JB024]|nr:DNA-binding protein [Verrucomicrobiota bacterium JB024]